MTPEREQTLLNETLEIAAERAGDLVPAVYERFFNADTEAHALMRHSDDTMQGRMFEGVLELLMTDEHLGAGGYLDWELDNHLVAYQATPGMYRSFLDAVVSAVRDALGSDWQPGFEEAWQQRVSRILTQVDAHKGA